MWYYHQVKYQLDQQQLSWRQAQCSGCGFLSAPRPPGETPENWERDANGKGRYWCPECVREGRGR